MSKIVMWFEVKHNTSNWGSSGTLYTKTIETIHVPVPGMDDVSLYYDADNEEDGMLWSIKRRWMDSFGTWNIELSRMHINPEKHMAESMASSNSARMIMTDRVEWITDNPHTLERDLLRSGWQKYDSRRA